MAFHQSGSAQSERCAFDAIYGDAGEDPAYQWMETMVQESRSGGVWGRNTLTIPVVFHVIYKNAEENIPDLQIRSQLDALNRDMTGLAGNAAIVPDEFRRNAASLDIRFCLAAEDPVGNPTTGITRTLTDVDDIGLKVVDGGRGAVHYDVHGGKDAWDPERYINIWIADLGGFLGFGTLPGMAAFPGEDGIILDPGVTGVLGTAADAYPYDQGRTLTHEMGHYLGLLHLWGLTTGCEDDDNVDDTPFQERAYHGCPVYPQVSCGSSDMFMNFMDLSDDRCLAMFTHGQRERVYNTLEVFRPMLLASDVDCHQSDPERPDFSRYTIFYSTAARRIIILGDTESDRDVVIRLTSIDGKVLRQRIWHSGLVFWMDANDLPGGIYVVILDDGRAQHGKAFAVF